MPSGHTSTSFASATYLASTYGLKWGIPAFSIATLVALERIKNDAHWLSDTIAGACLGIFWGRATYRHELNITPVVSRDTVGFNYQVRF